MTTDLFTMRCRPEGEAEAQEVVHWVERAEALRSGYWLMEASWCSDTLSPPSVVTPPEKRCVYGAANLQLKLRPSELC